MTKVYSTCGEVFNYDAPEFDAGEHYYSGDKVNIKPSDLLNYDTEMFIEIMYERLYDRVGDVAEDAISYTYEDIKQFEEVLAKFVDEHFSVGCYDVDNIEEHTMEEEK